MYATKDFANVAFPIAPLPWSAQIHYTVVDPWMTAQSRFDLSRFNALAGQFDLIIRAAEIFEIAIGAVTRQVAGAKQPGAGIGAERIDDEFFRGQFRPAPIARAKPSPPTYSSPMTPTGTGWRRASRRYTVLFEIGRPMATVFPEAPPSYS